MAQYTLTFTVIDAKAQSSRHRFYVNEDEELLFPTLVAYCQAYAVALDPNITGAIRSVTFSFDVPLPGGIKSAALPGSDVEEGRFFVYRTTNNYIFRHRVATFDEDVIPEEAIYSPVNLPASVQEFTDLIYLPLQAGWVNVDPCDNRGESITDFVRTVENFKKSRK